MREDADLSPGDGYKLYAKMRAGKRRRTETRRRERPKKKYAAKGNTFNFYNN